MGGISLRARDRELKIMLLREEMNLSFRQIGAQLGISHVAAYKRYWWAMDESLLAEQRREQCLNSICELLEGWIRYYEKLDSTAPEKGDAQRHTIMVNNDVYLRHLAESISAMTGKERSGRRREHKILHAHCLLLHPARRQLNGEPRL